MEDLNAATEDDRALAAVKHRNRYFSDLNSMWLGLKRTERSAVRAGRPASEVAEIQALHARTRVLMVGAAKAITSPAPAEGWVE